MSDTTTQSKLVYRLRHGWPLKRDQLIVHATGDGKVTRIIDEKNGRDWSLHLVQRAFDLRLVNFHDAGLWQRIVFGRVNAPSTLSELYQRSLDDLLARHVRITATGVDPDVDEQDRRARARILLVEDPSRSWSEKHPIYRCSIDELVRL